MKKILLFITTILLGFNLTAQTTLTQAVDFTATDCHGTEVHLFDILDGGQSVVIDFFYTTCSPCQQATPKVVEAYQTLGCNNHDVFFMEITPYDADAACQNWCNTYGVEYPTVGTNGGGSAITNSYGIQAFPTVILITPDRQIVIQDLYPIPSAQTIINALAPYGIEPHDCNTVVDPTIEISLGEITATTVEATFTPNETCASYYILIGIEAEMQSWVAMMGIPLEQLVQQWGIQYTQAETYTWTEQIPDTEYTVYALPLDADGNAYELQTQIATTESLGGTGTSVIDLQVTVLGETSVATIATPNEETAEYHYGLITKEYYEEIGADSALQVIRGDGWPLHEVDEWTWLDLIPNTYYYALGTGFNANNEWGETTLVEFMTSLTGIETLNEIGFSMYPNPANDFIKVSCENLKTATIYNALGQKIATYESNGSEINISTTSYNDGIYLININGEYTKRFVISH